jgi:hypothetical protein
LLENINLHYKEVQSASISEMYMLFMKVILEYSFVKNKLKIPHLNFNREENNETKPKKKS